ncbi:GRIP and coiled-coil domain-containing 2-like protein [Labeo rohita]|uniref:GRIP and coiled-coil domain-containing 2-like protein n=1 Tax=Labeo rohita TaxID=84645 RepID=A0A498NE57_LABRO|nr:GRIP and coiled-coil domain-containing 2-like protein [Labeo rohita]
METPQNSSNISFQDNKEIQDLLKQLKDAKTELQLTKDETEQVKKDVNKCTAESKQALLKSLLEEESILLEQERNLKLRREQLRKALADASANTEEVSQGENPVKPGSSIQSKSTEKPVRKRGMRK